MGRGRNPDRSNALGGHGPAQVAGLDVAVVRLFVDGGAVTEGAGAQGEGLAGLDAADRPAVAQVVEVELGMVSGEDRGDGLGAAAVAPGIDEAFGPGRVVVAGAGPGCGARDGSIPEGELIDPGSGESEAGAQGRRPVAALDGEHFGGAVVVEHQ